MFLTGTEMVLAMPSRKASTFSPQGVPETSRQGPTGTAFTPALIPGLRTTFRFSESSARAHDSQAVSEVRMKFVGANPNARVTGVDEWPGKSNYFIGNDPKKWHTNVPIYGRVRFSDLYPGVDLVYYGSNGRLEYDWVVAQGADPDSINFELDGADSTRVDSHGDLVISVGGSEVRLLKPVVYQPRKERVYNRPACLSDRAANITLSEASGFSREYVEGRFTRRPSGGFGFKVGTYDLSKPLIIDPVLAYSTYLGGNNFDAGRGVAVDSVGDAYIAGQTASANFPTLNGFQSGLRGVESVFVAKFDPTQTGRDSLIYSTYIGGSEYDNGQGLAVDASGNAYIVGTTNSNDFPVKNAFQPGLAAAPGNSNAFLTKLSASGSELLYSSYLGGSDADAGAAIALDPSSDAYITGYTYSTDFPVTAGAFQTRNYGDLDAFVAKFDPTQSGTASLIYSTYLGGTSYDYGYAIAVDSSGNAYVTGSTQSPDFPTEDPIQPALAGSNCSSGACIDAFVSELNSTGSALVYSTYLGGGSSDYGYAIAVDAYGQAYVAGTTGSTDFPTTVSSFQSSYQGGASDGFVAKFSSGGTALAYCTFLGGNGTDGAGNTIAVDSSGNAYVVGTTQSTNFPTVNPYQESLSGSQNAFVTILRPTGAAAVFSTYLGGNVEYGNSIAIDSSRNAYVAGSTYATNFPTVNPYQGTFAGGSYDAFLSKFETGLGGFQQVPGSLSQLSVGSDGTVWGLSSAGQIWMFNPETQTWLQAPGLLTQVTVASNGVVWGLNAAGQIYRYDPATQSWDQIAGILSQLAVGADGDVWGINSAGQVFHFSTATQTWVQIPGALAQLAVGYDGAVWGLNASQQVYRFNPGTQNWQQVGGLLKQVAVGADGDVWGINSAGQTFHFNTLSQQWQNTGASLAKIAVGSASNVWGLDSGGGIWSYNGQAQAWNQVPGQLVQIAVGENGAVWGVNSEQQIYQFVQPTQPTQTFHLLGGSLAQVVTGLDGNAWGIDASRQVWHFNAQLQSWQQIPGGLSQIAVGFGGNVWGLNAAGQIWLFNPSTPGWGGPLGGLLAQIAVGADGAVWGLNSAGQIWHFNSFAFVQIPGSLAQLAVGADGTVWGLNSAGQIFRFNPSTQGWDQIPGSLSQIAVGSANNVWGINATGQVFRYDSQLQTWDSIPGVLTSLAVAFDGTVWGLNSAQQVWRFNVQTQGWDSIAGQMTQISVGADAVVWGLDASGQTYEYW
jgi:hypothetical protein